MRCCLAIVWLSAFASLNLRTSWALKARESRQAANRLVDVRSYGHEDEARGGLSGFSAPTTYPGGAPTSRFLTERSMPFWVDGKGLPDIDFDIGESYAGLLPISDNPAETRKLFFWFFPSTYPNASNEVAIWLNGEPGCSSLIGLMTQNGPFIWPPGAPAPMPNPYSWVNLTNVLWVEQPVGVGFTQGTPGIADESGLSQQFMGFYKQFVDTFGLLASDVYLASESYGGYYVPYIADAFIKANDKNYFNLKGISLTNPIIGDDTNQGEVASAQFMDYWQNLLYLNTSFTKSVYSLAEKCQYQAYLDKYMTFPPPGLLPKLPSPYFYPAVADCAISPYINRAALEANQCFNAYNILDACPAPQSALDSPSRDNSVISRYLNRPSVRTAIHAPPERWSPCVPSNRTFLPPGDQSPPPASNGVLARVIEHTNNTFIGSGNLDFVLPTNGTLLALQNVTWNGKQGFQVYPGRAPLRVPGLRGSRKGSGRAPGRVGSWGRERGVTFWQVQRAGHGVMSEAPGAAYRVMEVLLGRVNDLGNTGRFSTQS
ncbi:alpha/beta-hydrolase [Trichodelitschia bisporula]|uniref:Carboxypeptidase n=1 Tax=Trichodelitschia bisporula TaxID=703511 RepID=A0A6G1HTQ9_9PEZI|nr:alpha/beta-hydrolase [Trichodelitschia bisporula]